MLNLSQVANEARWTVAAAAAAATRTVINSHELHWMSPYGTTAHVCRAAVVCMPASIATMLARNPSCVLTVRAVCPSPAAARVGMAVHDCLQGLCTCLNAILDCCQIAVQPEM